MDWIGPVSHRLAVAAFLAGDFFLGRYASNFFGWSFLPQSRIQLERLRNLGIDSRRICLDCWHHRREQYLEDELHVLL
eukprot:10185248-Karenia_brevis.AAC.1